MVIVRYMGSVWSSRVWSIRARLYRSNSGRVVAFTVWRSTVVFFASKKMGFGGRVPRRSERCVADRRQRRHNGARSHAITVWDEKKKKEKKKKRKGRNRGGSWFTRYDQGGRESLLFACFGFFVIISVVIIAAWLSTVVRRLCCASPRGGTRERAEGWKCEKTYCSGWLAGHRTISLTR